jgi:flagellar basal-body rod modification protein FlgD
MSTVSPVSSSNAVPAPTLPASSTNTLGKDDFLKLLVAQMSNQDPLSPVDDTAFVAQLAQFSTVEQLQSANTSLSSLLVSQAAGNQTAAASLVGKDVKWQSSTVQLGTGPTSVQAQLSAPAASVTAQIIDSSGRAVRVLHAAGVAQGQLTIPWDGKDDQGNTLPPGAYTFSITAADSTGAAVTATQESSGHVSGISFAGGSAQLVVGGVLVNLSDVIEIDQPTGATP